MDNQNTITIDYKIREDLRPVDPLEWYEQWTAIMDPAQCPLRPMRRAEAWMVPVLTNIKIQYNLDFESRLFGPEILLATGGGEYRQRVLLVPINGQQGVPAHPSQSIWFYEEKVSWLPEADVPIEGLAINYPSDNWGEDVELPLYRDTQFVFTFDNMHQLPDLPPPEPPIMEGFPQPQGSIYISLRFYWKRMSTIEFGIARSRDTQKVYG